MDIHIKIIPAKDQRYKTEGDWWFDKKSNLQIRVSRGANWKEESLIAVHELIEFLLCKHRGIKTETVDKFDKKFEMARTYFNVGEPGDDVNCPYRKEHFFATTIERLLSDQLGV